MTGPLPRAARAIAWVLMATLGLGEVCQANLAKFLFHAGGGIVALALGPWQFWTAFRNRSLRRHRLIGRVYLSSVMVGGVGGLIMATLAYGGSRHDPASDSSRCCGWRPGRWPTGRSAGARWPGIASG